MGLSFFLFKNAPTPLCLSRDKIKGQFRKNTVLTPIKTWPKKQGHSIVDFQLLYSTYKLDSQNKNYIYTHTHTHIKIKTQVFFFYKIRPLKKKARCTGKVRVMRLVFIIELVGELNYVLICLIIFKALKLMY